MKKMLCTVSLALLLSASLLAQDMLQLSQTFLKENLKELSLTSSDVSNMNISDHYTSSSSGITNIYFQQTHAGIGLYNGILNVHLTADGKVLTYGNRFVPNLKNKTNTATPTWTAEKAIESAANQLGYRLGKSLQVLEAPTGVEQRSLFSKGDLSQEDIPVKLVWQLMPDKKAHLCWDLSILALDNQNWWSVRIDARTGELLNKTNWMVHCNWEDPNHTDHQHHATAHTHQTHKTEISVPAADWTPFMAGSYRVYPVGVESPIHGNLSLEVDPHSINASPFGWHDTNGAAGAEFNITRGNNVYAQEDINGGNTFGYAPDGGAGLVFDFPPDFQQAPTVLSNQNAALTNLFYWNNIIHDVLYEFGFTEECGNFQENNYGNGGLGNDFVIADGLDGSGINNANFATPADGTNPRMQMFLWNAGPSTFNVNSPPTVSGGYIVGNATFGPATFNVTGDLVAVSNDGCTSPLTPIPAGRIALIDRGACAFTTKVENAESAGAAGVVICNNVPGDEVINMGGTPVNPINIPSVMLSFNDCATLRTAMSSSNVNITMANTGIMLDGDFDNGIIAHEYGHGVSNRLTGGPGTGGCLAGDEQMGEGWSDFIGLYLTSNSGNTGPEGRGIGNYATGNVTTGGGIRPYPYSTDMNINPHTYDSISVVSIPHGVGSVWCSMLWEMYWALVDEYGFNNDYYGQTGGNNIAFRLFMEGLKLQPCNPGFVDGRNAILAADEALFGGANKCLIWEAFAKRGLGFSASQGSLNSVTDGTQAFDLPPCCKLILNISVNQAQALPGTQLEYTLTASNPTTGTLTPVKLSAEVPANTTYVSGGTLVGNTVCFGPFSLAPGEIRTETFIVEIDGAASITPFDFSDDLESGGGNWTTYATYAALNDWAIVGTNPNGGSSSWFAADVDEPNTQYLTLAIEQCVTNSSTLTFFHDYNTEATWDGGTVEISTDNGDSWTDLSQEFNSNGYNSNINQSPTSPAFSGDSNGYISSTVDLSSYADQFVLVRFIMHCDASAGDEGWYIDDIGLTDLLPSIPNQATADCNGQIITATLENPTLITDILPLELTDFSGKALDKTNALHWTTAQESNISKFKVERSIDGKNNWTLVGQQAAKGESNNSHSYQLEDAQPLAFAFYRLRIIENDGKEFFSPVIFIQRKEDDIKAVKVFPNPVRQLLNVEFTSTKNQSLNLVVQNVLGQEQIRKTILAQTGLNRQQLDVHSLQSGVYWMVLKDGETVIWDGKIVVD